MCRFVEYRQEADLLYFMKMFCQTTAASEGLVFRYLDNKGLQFEKTCSLLFCSQHYRFCKDMTWLGQNVPN